MPSRNGEAAFRQDKKTQFAVVRSLEIVGEATKRISSALKTTNSQVPWRAMASMRDRLIHDCFGVDLTIVWEVVESDLAQLDVDIASILATLPQ